MSQAGILNTEGEPPQPGTVQFLQGNDGIPVGPNASGIIFTPGDAITGYSYNNTANTLSFESFNATDYTVDANAATTHKARFASIQAAVNQARTDGAASTNGNWKVVYVRPGTYLEGGTLTIYDGIIVKGLDMTGYSVVLTCNIILSTSGAAQPFASMQNLTLAPTSGQNISLSAGTISMLNVVNNSIAANTFNLTTTANKSIVLEDCTFSGNGASTFLVTDGSANQTIAVNLYNSGITYPTIQTVVAGGAGSTFNFFAQLSNISATFNVSTVTLSAQLYDCGHTATGGLDLWTTSAGTTGTGVAYISSTIQASSIAFWTFGNAGCTVELVQTQINNATFPTARFSPTRCSYAQNFNGILFRGAFANFSGAYQRMFQLAGQTLSGSPVTLVNLAVPAGTTVTVRGKITGSNVAHSDCTGGDFVVVADGTLAAIVGAPYYNIVATSTGTFSVAFSGGNLEINVTAPSSAAYNWITTYEVQTLLVS